MNFDTFIDKIVLAGQTYSAAQAAGYKFTILKDSLKIKQGVRGAFIYANFGGLIPTETGRNIWQHEATFNLDCVAINSGSSTETGDEKSLERLRYLIGQVLDFILNPNDRDLGMTVGDVANLQVKNVTPFPLDIVTELGVQGLRVVVTAEFNDEASATGDTLEQITVTSPTWGAVFDNE